uniref:mRNA splicing factor PRP17 n=1 Tax=Amorphochlora amoebiformis TaxID=1561963 RepID=A0A0H5BIN3_9EUKA|nr:mRNA splicing factor PRP17 [Amorphochlora amoebiformis]
MRYWDRLNNYKTKNKEKIKIILLKTICSNAVTQKNYINEYKKPVKFDTSIFSLNNTIKITPVKNKISKIRELNQKKSYSKVNRLNLLNTIYSNISGVNLFNDQYYKKNLLVDGGLNGTLKFWRIFPAAKILNKIILTNKPILHAFFNKKKQQLVINSLDKLLTIIEPNSIRIVNKISINKIISSIRLVPNYLGRVILGTTSGKVLEFCLNSSIIISIETLKQTYNTHLGMVSSIYFLRNNQTFITTSKDRSIRIWKLGITNEIKTVKRSFVETVSNSIRIHRTNTFFLNTVSEKIYILQLDKNKSVRIFKFLIGHSTNICASYSLVFSTQNKLLISGDSIGNINYWHYNGQITPFLKFRAHSKLINCIRLMNEENTITSSSWDGKIKIWSYG